MFVLFHVQSLSESESESEDDCDADDVDFTSDFHPVDCSVLEFFNSCGLLNLDQQLRGAVNNNAGNSQTTQSNSNRSTVLNNATNSRSKKQPTSIDNELEESCWLQKDTNERPQGISYFSVLSNTISRRPSRSLLSRNVKKHNCVSDFDHDSQSLLNNEPVASDKQKSTKKVSFLHSQVSKSSIRFIDCFLLFRSASQPALRLFKFTNCALGTIGLLALVETSTCLKVRTSNYESTNARTCLMQYFRVTIEPLCTRSDSVKTDTKHYRVVIFCIFNTVHSV